MRLALLNLKGGTGKATSALSWDEAAGGFDFSTVALPVRDLHRRLPQLARGYKHLVIDTLPGDAAIVPAPEGLEPAPEAPKKKVRITVDLDPETHRFLRVYAAERGKKVSEAARGLIGGLKRSGP